jgi:pyruvate-formate lyase-activating enzyme
MDSGRSTSVDKVNRGVNANDLATCVAITGGEPLLQQSAVFFIALNAWAHNKKVWLYTSYEFDEIPEHILQYCDVVKTGWYDESKRIYDGVLATSNQRYHYKGDNGIWTSS